MKRIDRQTVQRILDTADIVEVVSDFVSLKKRGANYIGLCPFHNERTPSFSVSRAKGICKCFSCGKGGSPVNFIMEHEQMSFNEALRYLAKKYHIEIKEYEMTDEQREQESQRESMIAVNEFALKHFSHNLLDTPDGRDIGLAYFRERGINQLMIDRFKLGYALDKFDDLYKAALQKGFEEKYLLETGLCARTEKGSVYDKFKGRVIYPLLSVSGRVIAFGGRTLRSDKNVAKYINSPQSVIYNKSRELYGLFQAKSAIVKQNKCILVEGYMDVISMHQAGIENVVASSGTSLTDGQIRLIHRFTENVTVIYDSDAAGIKASLRGIDMLLAEGINVKVLLLPDGDDPDSFAQHHSSAEVEKYIAENETDFIRFKTRILLEDAKDDPIARAKVINNIIQSIAVIPDTIIRAEYIKECSRMLDIGENTLVLQLKKCIADNLQKKSSQPRTTDESQTAGDTPAAEVMVQTPPAEHKFIVKASNKIEKCETELMKYIVRYGMAQFWTLEDGSVVTVLEYVMGELENDQISLTSPILRKIFEDAVSIYHTSWPGDLQQEMAKIDADQKVALEQGRERIRQEANDLADIQYREKALIEECETAKAAAIDQFACSYLENILISSPDDAVRKVATNLVFEPYTLSKVHTKYAHIETERERLNDLLPRAVVELKLEILNQRIDEIYRKIKENCQDAAVVELLMEQKRLYELRSGMSKYLGERIVTPK